jgi:phage recombination protein Bet
MTNELIKAPIASLSELLANADANIYHTLKNSIYPGAKDESIGMVLAYCTAKKYDPLAKAVHIVPMKVKTGKKAKSSKGYDYDVKEDRDVIMPGIASYRIDATRTGAYAGMTEPEFGSMITEKLGNEDFTFPEWCKVTVKKLLNGQIVEFTALEFWIENYATAGNDTTAPNAMWKKRKRGQLAKCTEAQALRKAFPDAVGNVPTFEEMEGKNFDVEAIIESENKIVSKGLLGVQAVKQAIKQTVTAMHEHVTEKAEALNIDQETGEVTDSNDTGAPSFDEVKKQLENAKTRDELMVAKDVAGAIKKTKEQHEELSKIYKNKQLEVKG